MAEPNTGASTRYGANRYRPRLRCDGGPDHDRDDHDNEWHDHERDTHPHDHDHDGQKHHHDHDHHAHDLQELGVAVVTVSTSRTADDDPSGDAIIAAVESEGYEVVTREIVDDDYDGLQGTLDNLTGRGDVDAVVTTGGTGVTPDDVTVEAATPLFTKELPGFGELFRTLSFESIGTKVVGTRATAGLVEATPVFCLPGSENAARLGISEIILPEVSHLAGLARRDHDE